MINTVVKLTSPQNIELSFREEKIEKDKVIVRPTYMSICAADQRYYQGKRKKEVLDKKLPLTLIHEAVGRVIYDPTNTFSVDEPVVMIPNTPEVKDEIIKENYRRNSKFRSSSMDGFMQNTIIIDKDRLISIKELNDKIASQLELISVAVNAVENFKEKSHSRKETLAVWGDGSVGYITALVLKKYYPESKIIVVGKRLEKLSYFSFADQTILNNEIDGNIKVDHAFECVGGSHSADAINQIIDIVEPQGCISILGVSEDLIGINTRMILEKGLTILGNSRSSYEDFAEAVEILKDKNIEEYVSNIISEYIEINSLNDINTAFEHDINNDFKTVMKWNL